MTARKTSFSPSWQTRKDEILIARSLAGPTPVIAEHSRYFAADVRLAIFSPSSTVIGFSFSIRSSRSRLTRSRLRSLFVPTSMRWAVGRQSLTSGIHCNGNALSVASYQRAHFMIRSLSFSLPWTIYDPSRSSKQSPSHSSRSKSAGCSCCNPRNLCPTARAETIARRPRAEPWCRCSCRTAQGATSPDSWRKSSAFAFCRPAGFR